MNERHLDLVREAAEFEHSAIGSGFRGDAIPHVIERTGRGERVYDLYSRLLEDRIVFVGHATRFNDDGGEHRHRPAALFLQKETQEAGHQPLHQLAGRLHLRRVMAIYDTMQFVQCDGRDVLHRPGDRAMARPAAHGGHERASAYIAAPLAAIMLHQPSGGVAAVPRPDISSGTPRKS